MGDQLGIPPYRRGYEIWLAAGGGEDDLVGEPIGEHEGLKLEGSIQHPQDAQDRAQRSPVETGRVGGAGDLVGR